MFTRQKRNCNYKGGNYSRAEATMEYEYPRKRKSKNKRRFSDDQIRSLESMFENETRVEPRKKVEVARELGLQPRQVAIWFQNKRARYKSKQLEHDYAVLRATFNTLKSRFDNLNTEKQALLLQLQKLHDQVESNNKVEFEEKAIEGIGMVSDDDNSNYFEHKRVVEPADSSLSSAEDWGNFDSDGLFNQSNSSCQWWDFWS